MGLARLHHYFIDFCLRIQAYNKEGGPHITAKQYATLLGLANKQANC
jgi:hypothetical protein